MVKLIRTNKGLIETSLDDFYLGNKAMIVHVANRYSGLKEKLNIEHEDLVSIFTQVFVKSFNRYDHTKGTVFSTLYYLEAHSVACKYYTRDKESRLSKTSYEQIIYNDGGSDITLLDKLSNDKDEFEDKSLTKEIVTEYIKSIENELHKKIIYQYFYNDMVQTAIASKYDMSQVQVSRIIKKYINKERFNKFFINRAKQNKDLKPIAKIKNKEIIKINYDGGTIMPKTINTVTDLKQNFINALKRLDFEEASKSDYIELRKNMKKTLKNLDFNSLGVLEKANIVNSLYAIDFATFESEKRFIKSYSEFLNTSIDEIKKVFGPGEAEQSFTISSSLNFLDGSLNFASKMILEYPEETDKLDDCMEFYSNNKNDVFKNLEILKIPMQYRKNMVYNLTRFEISSFKSLRQMLFYFEKNLTISSTSLRLALQESRHYGYLLNAFANKQFEAKKDLVKSDNLLNNVDNVANLVLEKELESAKESAETIVPVSSESKLQSVELDETTHYENNNPLYINKADHWKGGYISIDKINTENTISIKDYIENNKILELLSKFSGELSLKGNYIESVVYKDGKILINNSTASMEEINKDIELLTSIRNLLLV